MLCMTLENMRHDLRTPIIVIKGYLDYLRDNLPQGKVSNNVLFTTFERMSQSIMRLERYVECIKDI